MGETLERGELLRDVVVRAEDGREVHLSDFRGRRNIVLLFPADNTHPPALARELAHHPDLGGEEAVVVTATSAAAREIYRAPSSALFITDRYGEIFFSVRYPDQIPDAAEVLKWLEFINNQCPE